MYLYNDILSKELLNSLRNYYFIIDEPHKTPKPSKQKIKVNRNRYNNEILITVSNGSMAISEADFISLLIEHKEMNINLYNFVFNEHIEDLI